MLRRFASLAVLSAALSIRAETLVVFLDGAPTHLATGVLHDELSRLVEPAGIRIELKNYRSRTAGESFDRLIVASFRGRCVLDSEPRGGVLPGPLASTQTDGNKVLPFTEVFCDRVMQIAGAEIAKEPPGLRQPMLTRAFARVLSHEIFHYLAQDKSHSAGGAAKACFRASDLVASGLDFDRASVASLRKSRTIFSR